MNLIGAAVEALGQGFVKAGANIHGKWGRVGVAENIDGLASGVHNNPAFLAFAQVLLEFSAGRGIESFVEIIGQFLDKAFAVQFVWLP
jgi:hypothetical protein